MKFPGNSHHLPPPPPPPPLPATIHLKTLNNLPNLNLPRISRRPARRKQSTSATRLRRNGAPSGKRSRPETPSSKWKINERNGGGGDPLEEEDEKKPAPDLGRRIFRNRETVSARKLAAGLWRLQVPEVAVDDYLKRRGLRRISEDRFGLQLDPSFQFPSTVMEGAAKWDPVCLKTSDEAQHIYNQLKHDRNVSAVSALEAELEQARVRIQEVETERLSSKKKVEHFLKKVSEERASWRSREHEKIRLYINDIKAELNRERKSRQRIEIVNSRLVNELSDAKLFAKRYMQDYEKERKARELMEEVCDELAKEIGEGKVEVEAMRRESMKIREEAKEERKMLQMAEVWREERVQMKLMDAKVALDEKYSQMNKLVADLETFLVSKNVNQNAKEIREAVTSTGGSCSEHSRNQGIFI